MKRGYDGLRLRIFIHESLHHDGRPLYRSLVERARREGLAGATVFRGLEGYGQHKHLHASRLVETSDDLPMIVEIVDEPEIVRRFLDGLEGVVPHGMATLSPVHVVKYSPGRAP